MHIEFASPRLARLFTDSKFAVRQLGAETAWKFTTRVEILYHVATFAEAKAMRGLRCHLLEPRARNYWSIVLTDRWRLIVQPSKDGSALTIEDVSKHYGD